jgi:hypothetical protein
VSSLFHLFHKKTSAHAPPYSEQFSVIKGKRDANRKNAGGARLRLLRKVMNMKNFLSFWTNASLLGRAGHKIDQIPGP